MLLAEIEDKVEKYEHERRRVKSHVCNACGKNEDEVKILLLQLHAV